MEFGAVLSRSSSAFILMWMVPWFGLGLFFMIACLCRPVGGVCDFPQ